VYVVAVLFHVGTQWRALRSAISHGRVLSLRYVVLSRRGTCYTTRRIAAKNTAAEANDGIQKHLRIRVTPCHTVVAAHKPHTEAKHG
jgi:hypothetical protein